MNTVFSHIVRRRLSQENENVATEAMAFILDTSERARGGLMKLLRGIAPELPELRFRTQQTEGSARPDMWGMDGTTPRVFVENKFWAGLTENQPVEYLKILASKSAGPAVLLVVVPEARLGSVWREFAHRLLAAAVPSASKAPSATVFRQAVVDFGPPFPVTPILAITSWSQMLSAIDAELVDEPNTKNDLLQLRSLCDVSDEFTPFSTVDLTDQRTPSLLLQLNSIVKSAVDVGVVEGVVSTKRLNETHFWDAHGRYVRFPGGKNIGAWFGTDFRLWREHGRTPLWLTFSVTPFGRAFEIRSILEPWAGQKGFVSSVENDGGFVLGIDVAVGEGPDLVVSIIVSQLRDVATELSRLPDLPDVTQ